MLALQKCEGRVVKELMYVGRCSKLRESGEQVIGRERGLAVNTSCMCGGAGSQSGAQSQDSG